MWRNQNNRFFPLSTNISSEFADFFLVVFLHIPWDPPLPSKSWSHHLQNNLEYQMYHTTNGFILYLSGNNNVFEWWVIYYFISFLGMLSWRITRRIGTCRTKQFFIFSSVFRQTQHSPKSLLFYFCLTRFFIKIKVVVSFSSNGDSSWYYPPSCSTPNVPRHKRNFILFGRK